MPIANILDFFVAFRKGTAYFFGTNDVLPGGTGPCSPASYYTSPSLNRHTIYAPVNLEKDKKYPLLIWANGAGIAWGLMFGPFLREIASHGYIIIANGRPERNLSLMDHTGMLESLKWASVSGEEDTGIRLHIDLSRIALAGQSKGGLDTYTAAAALRSDTRVRTIALFNSGLVWRSAKQLAQVTELTVPVYYFIGGPSDVAYANAEKDWKIIPKDLPAWHGNLNVGHMGTYYDDENGGSFAKAAVLWLDSVLKEGEGAKEELLRYGERKWKVNSQNM